MRANAFAKRAAQTLDKSTITYRRADDIILITDPNNPDNREFYERYGRKPRLSLESSQRPMPFGDFSAASRR